MPPFLSLLSTLLLLPTALNAINPGFPYGQQKVRGVNLGGWLVLEPWITPSLFDNTGVDAIIDEYTFGQLQPKETAKAALKKHWDTWITEKDLADIAAAGLNHVRVPIGYWAFEVGPDEPFISGQLPYLKKAIGWASKHRLKVIVDLHGAPGSQNGFDNSGQKINPPGWHTNQTNVERTNAVMKTIASMFTDNPTNVPVIAPLNEPAGFVGPDMLNTTRQYWLDSYDSIRHPGGSGNSDVVVLIHDAFQPLSYWDDFMPKDKYPGVGMDTHIYQVFSPEENARTDEEHIQSACSHQNDLANFHMWTIVGEWCPAPTDCTKYLNGRGVGSRYDGSFPGSYFIGSCKGKSGKGYTFSAEYKEFLRKYWEAQVISYEKGSGWIQWTWKAEQADDWSYQGGLKGGWIPKDPTDLKYPNICDQASNTLRLEVSTK